MGDVPAHEGVVLLPRALVDDYLRSALVTDFSACFDDFRYTAVRLETLQLYDVPAEAERIAAFREHRQMPERSPQTNPFLRRIADTTAAASGGHASMSSTCRCRNTSVTSWRLTASRPGPESTSGSSAARPARTSLTCTGTSGCSTRAPATPRPRSWTTTTAGRYLGRDGNADRDVIQAARRPWTSRSAMPSR